MTELVSRKIKQVSSLIQDIRSLGALPQVEEGIKRVEDFLKTISDLDENSKVTEERILESLEQMEVVAMTLVRLAKKEKLAEEQKKNKWRVGQRK